MNRFATPRCHVWKKSHIHIDGNFPWSWGTCRNGEGVVKGSSSKDVWTQSGLFVPTSSKGNSSCPARHSWQMPWAATWFFLFWALWNDLLKTTWLVKPGPITSNAQHHQPMPLAIEVKGTRRSHWSCLLGAGRHQSRKNIRIPTSIIALPQPCNHVSGSVAMPFVIAKLLQVRFHHFLWSFHFLHPAAIPRPRIPRNDTTKYAVCFLPLPSSPWSTIGAVRSSCRLPAAAILKTSCCGQTFLYFVQKFDRISASRTLLGFTNPQSTCQQLFCSMKLSQLVIFKIGRFTDGLPVSKTDLSIGRDNRYFVTNSLLQSLSEFVSLHAASSVNPPERAVDETPKSATTFRAASIADRHEALDA